MANNGRLRQWVTPVTIGAFLISAFTGLALFFKINLPIVEPAHELFTLVLVIGTILHMIANWRPTLRYTSKPPGRVILGLAVLLTLASAIPLPGGHSENPATKVFDGLTMAPLHVVAQVAGHEPDEAMNILKSKGMVSTNKEQTVSEIAIANRTHPMKIITAIF